LKPRPAFYGTSIVLAALVALFQWYMFHYGKLPAEVEVQVLSQLQEKELAAFLDMNRLLVTLATTLLGATGFLLTANRKTNQSFREFWAVAGCGISVGLSLYFGYEAYIGILWMLKNTFFDLDNPAILWSRYAHFYTFLLGVLLFADFAFHELRKDGSQ